MGGSREAGAEVGQVEAEMPSDKVIHHSRWSWHDI